MHCFPHLCDYLMQLLPAVSAAFSMLVLTVFPRPVALKLLSHSFPPLFSVKQSKTPGMFLAFSDACSAISQHACGSDLSLASTLRSKMESSKSAFPLHLARCSLFNQCCLQWRLCSSSIGTVLKLGQGMTSQLLFKERKPKKCSMWSCAFSLWTPFPAWQCGIKTCLLCSIHFFLWG